MSVVEQPAHHEPQAVDGLERILQRGGHDLRERMASVERHLEHVVEDLEGEPDPPRESPQGVRQRARPVGRRERSQAAGGLEQGRRL
ncbi:MAG TPA: hypothetical protein VMB91_07030, partial [Solirubrobacteraceae bacterium]|nr:hypothetical protein [Solirubrobacteraceae bacterium]